MHFMYIPTRPTVGGNKKVCLMLVHIYEGTSHNLLLYTGAWNPIASMKNCVACGPHPSQVMSQHPLPLDMYQHIESASS
jgi:hypothetical protein